ncbi:prepilin-type N-terminal cleavage/methylation domain-containing protein [Candidatus Wolfebacteria bacterium]|nr:prepilin-type N-terminal cleavage/methylation domain-containing protein [Candidatus Wolfebacteria bacterium]
MIKIKKYAFQLNKGFTIIEVLIVMGILGTIFIFGVWTGLNFYEQYNINVEFNNLISVLRKARNLSIGNFNESPHGIYIEQNRYTVYQGNSYSSRNPSFDEVFAPQTIKFSGLGDIIFSQLSGDSSASGTISVNYLKKNKSISINYEGKID